MNERNPQAHQMADESMVRCLEAQAAAVWPQEQLLLERYEIPSGARVLDVGCGTGAISIRIARLLAECTVVGVDLVADHLRRARRAASDLGDRVQFIEGDAFHLGFEDDRFDLTLCRHVVQAVPDPHLVLAEMARVTKSGGRLHIVAEDYAMMHHHPTTLDTDLFWHTGPMRFARETGTDLRIGRKLLAPLLDLGIRDVEVNYVVVDTARVPREVFAAIWEAWRDGYSDAIVDHSPFTAEEVAAYWREMIAAIRDPRGYAVWHLPVWSGIVP